MKELTKRQREIFDYIRSSVVELGRPPSLREIGEEFGINSTNGVRSVLEALERKGYIRRNRYLSRGIEIIREAPAQLDDSRLREVPVIGRVENDTLLLDMRTVADNEMKELAATLSAVCREGTVQ